VIEEEPCACHIESNKVGLVEHNKITKSENDIEGLSSASIGKVKTVKSFKLYFYK
jgi:hypothetical protein